MTRGLLTSRDWRKGALSRSLIRVLAVAAMMTLGGCDMLDMYDQPRYESLESSRFFADGLSARPAVPGTIPRGGLREDRALYTGKSGKQFVTEIPDAAAQMLAEQHPRLFSQSFEKLSPSDKRLALLTRGRERFEIYCSVCHGRTGGGDGMIVRRGFVRPPSFHQQRLREAPVGYFFDVITNGLGAMSSYANRIEVQDRWAIAAYLRALQLSQNAVLDDVPNDARALLNDQVKNSESPAEPGRKEAP